MRSYWALALLHRAFPDEGWGEAADRIGSYLATSRDEVEDHWPALPDHWAAYGQAETVEFPERAAVPLTDAEVGYARRQAELFGSATRWVSQQAGPWGKVVRGGDTPRGGGYGVISEALTGWWLVAQREPGMANLEGAIAERASCIAGLTVDAQSDGDEAASAVSPERVEGAWVVDGETRMDDQQHALAGLLRTVPIVEASEALRLIRSGRRPALGLAVGHRPDPGAQPGPSRVRGPARGAVVSGRRGPGGAGRRDRRAGRVHRRGRGGSAPGRARRQRPVVPRRRGDRRRDRRRGRPVPATTPARAITRRLAGRAGPGGAPGGRPAPLSLSSHSARAPTRTSS